MLKSELYTDMWPAVYTSVIMKNVKIQGEVLNSFLAEVHILLPVCSKFRTSTSNTAASFGLGHLLLSTAFLQTFVNKEQVLSLIHI